MHRRAGDASLAAMSAALTLFTFKIRAWTGLRESSEWPLAAAILLMVITMLVQRNGVRIGLLLASLIGIGFGLTIASLIHRIEVGRTPLTSLFFLMAAAVCTWLYIRGERLERTASEEFDRFEKDFEAIKAMPRDQAVEALRAHLEGFSDMFDDTERATKRMFRRASFMIALAMILTVTTLPSFIQPSPKPLAIILDASILALGTGWFIMLALMKRKDREPTEHQDA